MFGNSPKITLWHLKGIPIRLDATFILVPLFFYQGLSLNLEVEKWPAVAAGTAGLFLSILLHEIGHALTAKQQQVGVREIVVGGFYGYANLKRQAIPRKVLIRILAAGPFANLAVFLVLWLALSVASPSEMSLRDLTHPVGSTLGWPGETARVLALVNLAMFLFNLLPAFPLDGGRILGLLLDRNISAQASNRIVAGLGIVVGAAVVLFGAGLSVILAVMGIMIIMINLRRLRQRSAARRQS